MKPRYWKWVLPSLVVLILAGIAAGKVFQKSEPPATPPAPVMIGSITGTIVDIVGNPLPGVKIELSSEAGDSLERETNSDGEYLFDDMPRGDYVLQISSEGEQKEIELGVDKDNFMTNVELPLIASEGFDFMPAVDADAETRDSAGAPIVAGEIVVRWKADVSEADRNEIVEDQKAEMLADTPEIELSVLAVAEAKRETIKKALNKNPAVVLAIDSFLLETEFTPTDKDYGRTANNWWLKQVNSEPAWDISTGSPYRLVGVVDGGFTLDHEDLAGAFVPARANYSDDADYTGGDHGTHVTGIIGMRVNNEKGMVGIAPTSRMAVAKTTSMARVADAFRFFARCDSVSVISISMGNNWWSWNEWRAANKLKPLTAAEKKTHADKIDVILAPAVTLLATKDKLIVHSAGNDADDAALNTLNFDSVVTVAASDQVDKLAKFSNRGARVDIAAPGVAIYSTVPSGYGVKNGTSMATPLTAGAAALVRQANPGLKASEVKEILTNTAVKPAGLKGNAFGRLDVWRALLLATDQMGVEGVVYDATTGMPIPDVQVKSGGISLATSDNKGAFQIAALPFVEVVLEAESGKLKGKVTIAPPAEDRVVRRDIFLSDEKAETDETDGSEPDTGSSPWTVSESEGTYVIWIGTNANVGINISWESDFGKDVLARGYSGGGIDPEKLLERKLFVENRFPTQQAANDWLCSKLTDVRVWPLGQGLHGKYIDGESYGLGNIRCEE